MASAKAALEKLREMVGQITPGNVLALTAEQLRACYFSRQKAGYAKSLATAFINKQIILEELIRMPADKIREHLKLIKGIGDWTADVFMLMSLHHLDVLPLGDIALVNSIKHIKGLQATASKDEIRQIAEAWKPYRSIATYIFWHAYLMRKQAAFKTLKSAEKKKQDN